MRIKVEFNPDLALRKTGTLGRLEEECIPEILMIGEIYPFRKEGQRNYWLEGEIPLVETKGNQHLSRPLASITIVEAKHTLRDGKVYTIGIYRVNKVFNPEDPKIHFEGFSRRTT